MPAAAAERPPVADTAAAPAPAPPAVFHPDALLDRGPPRAERVDRVLPDTAHLEAVAPGPLDQRDARTGQLAGQQPLRYRVELAPCARPRLPVEGAVGLIGAVGARHQV